MVRRGISIRIIQGIELYSLILVDHCDKIYYYSYGIPLKVSPMIIDERVETTKKIS